MNAEEYKTLLAHDVSLQVGQEVWFRFTNNNRFRRVKVKIAKINAKSVLGENLEEVKTDLGTYPKGHVFKVPRITDLKGWTANNRVEPLDG